VDSRRFTVPEAAQYLSATESSIRHKVNRNTIPHEKDEETNRVYILIDKLEDERLSEDNQRATSDDPSDKERLTERLVDALTSQLEEAQESLRQEREANRENRRLLAAALERIPALETPVETPSEERESPVSASESAPSGSGREEESGEPRRRGWWGRLFLGE
jgi:hypothetical protein